jgi:hypothetical protein
LLLEPQRTNVITYSEDVTNWGQNQTPVVTLNNGTAPDGTTTADKVVVNAASEGFYNFSGGNVASGTTYTTSIFIKYISGATNLYFGFAGTGFGGDNLNSFNIQNGTVTSSAAGNTCSVVSYGNGWYRLIDTKTANAVSTGGFILYGVGSPETQYLVWGAQLEAGAHVTSYIPTSGASVTRVADAASKTGISSLIGQTEGTLFIDLDIYELNLLSDRGIISVGVNGAGYTSAVYVSLYNNDIYFACYVAGVQQASGMSKTISTAGRYKIAAVYKQNDFALYVNGQACGTDTSGNLPSTLSVVGIANINEGFNGYHKINQALLFPTRLTNAQLAELTTL